MTEYEYKVLFKLSSKLSKLFNQLNDLLKGKPHPEGKLPGLLIRDIIKKIEYNSFLYKREVYRTLHLKENDDL
ncbi:MAG: hypothetical protein ACE5J3_07630 [Methanosarcinales archaeon]